MSENSAVNNAPGVIRRIRQQKKEKNIRNKKHSFKPQTADDFLYQGSTLEDSGDRWLKSDCEKAHRFYTQALESYKTSVGILRSSQGGGDGEIIPHQNRLSLYDALYNYARLLYHVYNEYIGRQRTEKEKQAQDLTNVIKAHEDAFSALLTSPTPGSSDLYYGELPSLVSEISKNPILMSRDVYDLLFNWASAIADYQELFNDAPDERPLDMLNVTWQLQMSALEKQESTRQELVGDADNSDDKYVTVIQGISLSSLLETGTLQLKIMCDIVVSFCLNVQHQTDVSRLESMVGSMKDKAGQIDDVIQQLAAEQSLEGSAAVGIPSSVGVDITSAHLTIIRMELIIDAIEFILSEHENFEAKYSRDASIVELQVSQRLPVLALERQVSLADDVCEISQMFTVWSRPDIVYSLLSRADNLLSEALNQTSTNASGGLIAKARVWEMRGDISILRAKLGTEKAQNNRKVLESNGTVFYKNAINILDKVSSSLVSSIGIVLANGQSSTTSIYAPIEIPNDLKQQAQIKYGAILGGEHLKAITSIPGWYDIVRSAIEEGVLDKEFTVE